MNKTGRNACEEAAEAALDVMTFQLFKAKSLKNVFTSQGVY